MITTPISRYEPTEEVGKYILRMWWLSFVPTVFIGTLVQFLIPDLPESKIVNGRAFLYSAVIFAPIMETLLLSFVLKAGTWVSRNHLLLAVSSAIFWAVLHAVSNHPAHGLIIGWSFYVMSRAYMAWWDKVGMREAMGVTILIHMAHNLVPGMIIYFNTPAPK